MIKEALYESHLRLFLWIQAGEGVRGCALTQDSYVAIFAENCQIGVLRSFSEKEQNYNRL